MKNKKGLGRGLESLFDQNLDSINDETSIVDLQLSDIEPNPFQPRKTFDDSSLNELSQSIKTQGVFQPILVRKSIIGYEIISGERRYRASKLAGLDTIPAIVYEYDDKQMMEVGIIENIQREDLSVIEEAKSYQMLISNLKLTQKDVSERVGKSRSHIANMLRLLKLDDQVLSLVSEGQITMGHAKVLVNIEDKDRILEIANQTVKNGLTVREVEVLAQEEKEVQPAQAKAKKVDEKTNELLRLETMMREKLDARVKITGKNKGKLSIEFDSREDLERILEQLKLI
ncbi:ParB/RepB/Spo0J family partition protein [Mollicutes bacterium LVI A0078]|nr:ParB/RepB/Spo0J family partition protein [Mollicutes bacterium LVI A0075]WOO90818.1 ParB/RepB/Spo0J family partition protein [Mollicutes bacterium LVI A0078]